MFYVKYIIDIKRNVLRNNNKAVLSQRWPRDAPYNIGYSTLILFMPTSTTLRGFDYERLLNVY